MFSSLSNVLTASILNPVNCTTGELQLRGGATSQQGRVEMCYERQWGTVCDDLWGTNDAKVACRQLGFSSYGILHNLLLLYQNELDMYISVPQELPT